MFPDLVIESIDSGGLYLPANVYEGLLYYNLSKLQLLYISSSTFTVRSTPSLPPPLFGYVTTDKYIYFHIKSLLQLIMIALLKFLVIHKAAGRNIHVVTRLVST